jgi:hypothetical protein
MANVTFNSFKSDINGNIDWDDNTTTTIKVMLVTSTYTPDIDLHEFISDVTNEVVGTGYTAGGKAIVNRTKTIDDTLDIVKYDADDVAWLSSTITARGAVVYKDTGTPATSPLIGYLDFGADKSTSNVTFTIQWSAEGVFKVT